MHFKIKTEISNFFTDFIQFEHADFNYRDEIWPTRQNFAQIKL